MGPAEYWLVLIDGTPDIPDSSNRYWRVEFAPCKPEDFGGPLSGCLQIVHVRAVDGSPYNYANPRITGAPQDASQS